MSVIIHSFKYFKYSNVGSTPAKTSFNIKESQAHYPIQTYNHNLINVSKHLFPLSATVT